MAEHLYIFRSTTIVRYEARLQRISEKRSDLYSEDINNAPILVMLSVS